jgi:hypothetical protein
VKAELSGFPSLKVRHPSVRRGKGWRPLPLLHYLLGLLSPGGSGTFIGSRFRAGNGRGPQEGSMSPVLLKVTWPGVPPVAGIVGAALFNLLGRTPHLVLVAGACLPVPGSKSAPSDCSRGSDDPLDSLRTHDRPPECRPSTTTAPDSRCARDTLMMNYSRRRASTGCSPAER